MSTLSLKGRVERDMAALFTEQLASLSASDAPVVLDLSEADLEDPVAASMLVEAIRATAERVGAVDVREAPQVLAHALYRIGATEQGTRIRLIEPREEIGTSS